MKRITTIILLALVVLSLIPSCSNPATQTVEKSTALPIIKLQVSPFGTGTYSLFTAVESIATTHPKIRISLQETPGGIYLLQLIANENAETRWQDNAIISDGKGWGAALRGVGPFDKPLPNAADLRALFTYYAGLVGMVTLDKKYTDVKALSGARVALGKAPQTSWGYTPEFMLKEAYGLNPKIDYLGPNEAMQALLDRQADAAVVMVYASGDMKNIVPAASLVQLEASGRSFYYVNFDSAILTAAFKKYGFPVEAVNIAPNTLPRQTESVTFTCDPFVVLVHKTFPEDLAYEFSKLMYDNYTKFPNYAAEGKCVNPSSFVWGTPKELYHAGAIKAWKELGVWKE